MDIHYAKMTPLSQGFLALKSQSMAEGFNMLRRLEENWLNGCNRFDRPGEKLLGAYLGGVVIAACGLNIDPFAAEKGTGRLRHFYVDTGWRNRRVGSSLLREILKDSDRCFNVINTNAPQSAFTFYERVGFVAVSGLDKVTHQFCPVNPAT